ncbi:polyprenyl synthetase [Tanacetum coccineum]
MMTFSCQESDSEGFVRNSGCYRTTHAQTIKVIITMAHLYAFLQSLAFQLVDDVLDFIGTSSSLGKGSLSDIRHICMLVVIYVTKQGLKFSTRGDTGIELLFYAGQNVRPRFMTDCTRKDVAASIEVSQNFENS